MYPLDDDTLSFGDIAKHWCREQPPGTSEDEVLDRLLSAFWMGDLYATPWERSQMHLGDPRTKLLNGIAGLNDHPGLLFLRPGAEIEPETVALPDGEAELDLQTRVSWPTPEGCSASETTRDACIAMAKVKFIHYSSDAKVGLLGLNVERGDFGSFCAQRGYPRPRFWFTPSQTLSSAAAKSQCRRWLQEKAQRRDKPGTKAEMRADALRKFPGLSQRGFDAVWAKVAPQSWTRSGAPKGKRT